MSSGWVWDPSLGRVMKNQTQPKASGQAPDVRPTPSLGGKPEPLGLPAPVSLDAGVRPFPGVALQPYPHAPALLHQLRLLAEHTGSDPAGHFTEEVASDHFLDKTVKRRSPKAMWQAAALKRPTGEAGLENVRRFIPPPPLSSILCFSQLLLDGHFGDLPCGRGRFAKRPSLWLDRSGVDWFLD